jgi:deoxycytidylate deaminase
MKTERAQSSDQTGKSETVQRAFAFDWDDLAFASKKPLQQLNATFITAPRKMSEARLKQLIKTYLPKGNLLIGLAKESFVEGLDGNPAFAMLKSADIDELATKVNHASPKHKLYTLSYFQRHLPYILDKLHPQQVVLVRGSWHTVFHTSAAFYSLTKQAIPFVYVSPFESEEEAIAHSSAYETAIKGTYPLPTSGTFTAAETQAIANSAAHYSLDYTYQTGVALGRQIGSKYELLAWSYNKVVPYQTYAMHHGNSREDNFSPPNDQNHYDTIHAEINLLVSATKQGINLKDTTLFINLLPCPACARAISQTDINEIVYTLDHSANYAAKLFEISGKQIKRFGNTEPGTHS